jgi:prophage tail gpP-like protein
MSLPSLVVQLAGNNLQRVQSFSIRCSVSELADQVQVEVADDIALADQRIGASLAVAIAGGIVLVGEAQGFRDHGDASSSTVSFNGFSSAQRLTKSSIKIGDGESVTSRVFRGLSARQIIERVVRPFDLVVDVGETGNEIADVPIDKVKIKKNEGAWEFVQRVAKRQGLILVSGAASVTPDRKAKASIRLTRNAVRSSPIPITRPHPRVISWDYETDGRAIHSEIIVARKSKKRKSGGGLTQLGAPAFDSSARYSPLIIDAEAGARTEGELLRQAEFEVRKRRAEAIRVSIEVDGWSPNNSQALWWPNTLFQLDDRVKGFADTMLLTAVTLSRDIGGADRAMLEFVPPDAYAVLEDFTVDGGGIGGSRGQYRANPEWLRQHSKLVTEISDASDTVDFNEPKLELIFNPPEGT